jgi:hypothetical protein
MNVTVLSCGAIVVGDGDTQILFGAPTGVKEGLERNGVEIPDVVMLTSMRAPGFGRLGKPVVSYKEQPLRLNGIYAKPVQREHTQGTDYEIEVGGAKILFSERGDVAVKETEGYALAIIKNKHRADALGAHVVTWPWSDCEYLVNAEGAVLKEMVPAAPIAELFSDVGAVSGDNPTSRFGDVLVAALHTAYNDVSDRWYSLGYMNEEERKAVGQAIGDALNALRASAPPEVMVRELPREDTLLLLPKEIRELSDELPEKVTPGWTTVFKDAAGVDRWVSVTTSVNLDNHREVITPAAIKWALKFNEIIGTKGPLRFRHIPGLDGGDCTHQALVGDFLFEAGTFRDNPVGLAMKELLQNGTGWRMSPGLLYAPKDLLYNIFFKKMLIYERSMTQIPANPLTAILSLSNKGDTMGTPIALTEQQLKEAAEQLGLEVTQVKTLYDAAVSAGGVLPSVKEFVDVVKETMASAKADADKDEKDDGPSKGKGKKAKPPGDYAAEDTDTDDDEDSDSKKRTKGELEVALASLTAQERKEMREILDQVDSHAPETLRQEVTALKEAIATTNAQLNALVAAMTTGKPAGDVQSTTKEDVAAAVRAVLQSAPRAAFTTQPATTTVTPVATDDAAVDAKLKEIIEAQLKESGAGISNPTQFRSLFTSQALNRHRQ